MTAPIPLRRSLIFILLALLPGVFAVVSCGADDPFAENIRKTEPLTPAEERLKFHLPPGFEVQLVASEPEIGKPMNMAFDAQGRIWITQSREYPFAAPLDKPARDKIMVLSDFDSTGRAQKITTFAEGLNIPIGLYPYKNGVIAFSIPNIYFFQDTDGDGKADKQDLILGRFGFERDVHGLTSSFRRGYDGWLYADHGYNNDTLLTAKDGSTAKMNSGNTYRFRLDGSHVDHYTHGQVNPFGLMFDPLGDLWSADCHSSPVYQLLRGAFYPSFGKPDDGLGFGPNICDHLHGSTAIAGMVFYAADNFPPEFRDNTFVGNVMTCRINRDSLEEHGSTRIAREQPDFLYSDDPWFRPVDLQLGPDGAIYVADFYNRIIGHYEVPLTHPGRDRLSGRIWRISYGGKVVEPFDLSRAAAEALIAELANSNITRRMLAMNQLVDRIGQPAVAPLKKLLAGSKATGFQKIQGLWVLQRLGGLDENTWIAAAKDKDRAVRVHAMRILSESPEWSAREKKLALAGLKDGDPYVQRSAADALGMHPSLAYVEPLLELREVVPAIDPQLVHVSRMALRNQLADENNLRQLQPQALGEKHSRAIAEASLGINSAAAGSFILHHVQAYTESRDKIAAFLRHAVRFAPENEIPNVASIARTRFADDPDFQLVLYRSVEEGAAQRGGVIPQSLHDWGADLAERLLVQPAALAWRNSPVEGGDPTNPWVLQSRKSADGDQPAEFISSLTPGGEKFTGILKSRPFAIPAKLTFFCAGHDGRPPGPVENKNFVRLKDAKTGEIIVQASPPRNDNAQRISWDLASYAGQNGYLEIVDGNTGDAYAWLAVGRFNPEVVPLPNLSPSEVDRREAAAAEIVARLHLVKLEPNLAKVLEDRQSNQESRAAAARALATLNLAGHLNTLTNIVQDTSEPTGLRQKTAQTLGESSSAAAKSAVVEAFRTAPYTLQTQFALALATTTDGAEALLQAVSDGKAAPRLLQERNIKDRLVAAKPENLDAQLAKLTANLAPPDAARQKLIESRRAAFNRTTANASAGAAVFKQNCAVCHSIDGQGALIAPQLDGIGGRGLDRVLEDVLDPSRNVDRAFRTTVLVLSDGDVQTGLFRREEGEMLVLAESTGKEVSVAKKDVRERRESETSLMPDNFSDVIPSNDFNNLMAFLLSKAVKPPVAGGH
jgi:putative heme-binding domain-containing protein